VVLGPPKTGKTSLVASVLDLPDVDKVKVYTMRPKEASSYGYQIRNMRVDVINDPLWLPEMVSGDKLKSTAFDEVLKEVVDFYYDDTYDAVIIDPLTDIFISAGHKILAQFGVTNPADIPGKGSMQYYGDIGRLSRFFIQRLCMLTTAKRPKWVLATMHTKPVSEDTVTQKKSTDTKAKGIRFEGEVLPQMEGSYRYDLGGEFSIQVYTTVDIHYKDGINYRIQVTPDRERHAAVGAAPLLDVGTIPNTMKHLVKVVDDAVSREVALRS
jgi:hypothetical protein